MPLAALVRLRRLVGLAGAAAALCALLAVVDSLTQEYRGQFDRYQVLPGQSLAVGGPMPEYASSLEALGVSGGDGQVRLRLDAMGTSYWLGGRIWRGTVLVGQQAAPGEYVLKVRAATELAQNPRLVFRILVYPDRQALVRDATSLLRRWLGIMPARVAASAAAVAALAFGASFLLSGAIDKALAALGLADIFSHRRDAGGTRVRFGLGTLHGVTVGESVDVLDEKGAVKGRATVLDAKDDEAEALLDAGVQLHSGDMVRLGRRA